MPTAPSITSILVLEPPEDKVQKSDESPEEALTRVLSAGFGKKDAKEEDESG